MTNAYIGSEAQIPIENKHLDLGDNLIIIRKNN
jgi:hypothetical protein